MSTDEAKHWLRELLSRMVMEGVAELQLRSGSLPRFGSSGAWREVGDQPAATRMVTLAITAVTVDHQREALARGGRFDFHLLALGIGLFKAHAYSASGDFYLNLSLLRPHPPEGEQVPNKPVRPTSFPTAEATVII